MVFTHANLWTNEMITESSSAGTSLFSLTILYFDDLLGSLMFALA
jgi:hypothetical protein